MGADFLANLPSIDKTNFSKFSAETSRSHVIPKAKPCLRIKEPPAQVIVTEKTNILARYLHKQWEKKQNIPSRKRSERADSSDSDAAGPSTSSAQPSRKMPRVS